jgi:hypothetical protein
VKRDDGLQIDFLTDVRGIRKYESLRNRSVILDGRDWKMRVASLEDIIKSKRACNRPKDRAVLPILEQVQREIEARRQK